jgi:hypothetical protein
VIDEAVGFYRGRGAVTVDKQGWVWIFMASFGMTGANEQALACMHWHRTGLGGLEALGELEARTNMLSRGARDHARVLRAGESASRNQRLRSSAFRDF